MGVDAHRLEHGRRLQVLRGAGAPRVHRDAGLVEAEEHGLGLDAVDPEAHHVGQATGPPATDRRRARRRRPGHAVEHRAATVAAVGARRASPGRRAPADDRRHVSKPAAGPAPDRCRPAAAAPAGPAARASAPMPARATHLVGADSMSSRRPGRRSRSASGRRPGRRRRARARRSARHASHDLGDRLQRADLVVAPLEVDERGLGRARRRAGRRRRRARAAVAAHERQLVAPGRQTAPRSARPPTRRRQRRCRPRPTPRPRSPRWRRW